MGALRRVPKSILSSIILHGAFLLAWAFLGRQMPAVSDRMQKPQWTYLEVVPTAKKVDVPTQHQVVQTEKTERVDHAAADAFLGEQTQVIRRQTVSIPKIGTAPRVVKAESTAESQRKTIPAPMVETRAVLRATGALARFGIAISATKAESPKPEKSHRIEDAALTAQVRGEFVKGFKAGEETMLNTREFVFYGYFQRIRERLDREWERSLRDRLAKYFHRGRQLASEQDYMTQLLVAMDPSGKITNVQILGASGTRDLDEAAIKAFNDAGPFPNPPKGLVDASGQVLVRWDFVLKT